MAGEELLTEGTRTPLAAVAGFTDVMLPPAFSYSTAEDAKPNIQDFNSEEAMISFISVFLCYFICIKLNTFLLKKIRISLLALNYHLHK